MRKRGAHKMIGVSDKTRPRLLYTVSQMLFFITLQLLLLSINSIERERKSEPF